MIKTALLPLTVAFAAAAALAGPYVNVEANAGWTDLTTTEPTDAHVGYEGELSVNLVPTTFRVVLPSPPDGGDADTVPSGKAGLGLGLTDALGAYGEVSFIGSGDDDIDRGYGAKLGPKYSF